MSKHKNYDMIVAKAANTELVVFFNCDTGWYFDDTSETIKFHIDTDYFLCLPQHKEAVLNALSGGESEITYGEGIWSDCNCDVPVKWDSRYWYMVDGCESRIKPKKVKRWIGVTNTGKVTPDHYSDVVALKSSVIATRFDGWQFIEIEVEE